MRRLLCPALLLFAMAMTSCKTPQDAPESFFDSLIVAQARTLSAAKATLTKSADLRGEKASVTLIPDKTGWEKELEVFRQLGISGKPIYQSFYRVIDNVKDSRSNLLIRSLHSEKPIPVPDLKFYYYRSIHHLKRIEGVYQEGNLLFATSRKLTVEFDEVSGHPEIKSYDVDGTQKIVGTDSVRFVIHSVVHN